MRRLTLAIAVLAAAPAMAQPPTDWTKPVSGVDAPAASAPQIDVQVVDLTGASQDFPLQSPAPETEEERVRRWEREQALYAYRVQPVFDSVLPVPVLVLDPDDVAFEDTPLPPCEPPPARSVVAPPEPSSPPPAPCRP